MYHPDAAREEGRFKGKKKLLLQVDGASDNIAYTALYFAAWLLTMSERRSFGDLLELEQIRISRLPLGHTHTDIDQVFSHLARYLWGTKNNMHRAPDVHTVKKFVETVRKAHEKLPRKGDVCAVGACSDFDAMFADVKHDKTDTGIKEWRVFELRRNESQPGKVFLRTKMSMDSTEWRQYREGKDDEGQYWPNATGEPMPGPEMPALAPLKEWAKQEEVEETFRWFLQQDLVEVSEEDREALEQMLENFPDTAADARFQPEWPEVVRRAEEGETKEGGKNDERAADLEGGKEGSVEGGVEGNRPGRPAAFGLSAAERNHTAAVQAANGAFTAIADVRGGHLVMVGHQDNQGNRIIDIGEVQQRTNVAQGGTLKLEWYVNKDTDDANELVDLNGKFVKFRPRRGAGRWIDELKQGEFTVFWTGRPQELLKVGGGIRVAKMRTLGHIRSFPFGCDLESKRLVPVAQANYFVRARPHGR